MFAYVQEYNQRIHSSLNGKSPMERFFSESTLIIRMSDQEVERSFLLEIERKVSNDSVIVIDEKEYEVNYKYQGQKLLIRYSPDLKKVYVVDSISKELEPIQLLDKNKMQRCIDINRNLVSWEDNNELYRKIWIGNQSVYKKWKRCFSRNK